MKLMGRVDVAGIVGRRVLETGEEFDPVRSWEGVSAARQFRVFHAFTESGAVVLDLEQEVRSTQHKNYSRAAVQPMGGSCNEQVNTVFMLTWAISLLHDSGAV